MWKTIRTCIPKKSTGKKCSSADDKSVNNNFSEFFTSYSWFKYGYENQIKITLIHHALPNIYPESEQFPLNVWSPT